MEQTGKELEYQGYLKETDPQRPESKAKDGFAIIAYVFTSWGYLSNLRQIDSKLAFWLIFFFFK